MESQERWKPNEGGESNMIEPRSDEYWYNHAYMRMYANDHLSDPALRGLDYFDHGVYFHVMLLMCKSVKPGYLCGMDGSVLSDEEVADLLPSGDRERVLESIRRLCDKKRMVLGKLEDNGMLYSRKVILELAEQAKIREKGRHPYKKIKRKTDLKKLKDAGVWISAPELDGLKELHRGVDWDVLVGEAVREARVRKIENPVKWLGERAGEMRGLKKDCVS